MVGKLWLLGHPDGYLKNQNPRKLNVCGDFFVTMVARTRIELVFTE